MSCFTPDGSVDKFAGDFGTSVTDCESLQSRNDMPSVVQSEIQAGKITFSGTAAAQCLSGTTYPACATYWSAGPTYATACDSVFVGSVADGAACVVDEDCSNSASVCLDTGVCGADTGAVVIGRGQRNFHALLQMAGGY